ncbi:hypothetical protein CC80DRAFT_456958, partial [Byssothecium circinans]
MGDRLKQSYLEAQEPLPLYDDWKKNLKDGHNPNEEWTSDVVPKYGLRCSSPLFSAVLEDDLRLATLLLDHGATPEKHNGEGRTSLQEAVIKRNVHMVQLLLDRKAKPDTRMVSEFLCGGTALHIAVLEGQVNIVNILLGGGAEPLAKTNVGWTPVHVAVLDHQGKILSLLLDGVDSRTVAHYLPLGPSEPVEGDELAVASYLVEHGVKGTDNRHFSFYQTQFSRIIERLAQTTNSTTELSTSLIKEMDTFLTDRSNTRAEISWDRKLCDPCKRFEAQDPSEVSTVFYHAETYASLEQSAESGCSLCRLLINELELHSLDNSKIERPVLGLELSSKVRLTVEPHRADRQASYWLVIVCGNKVAYLNLEHVNRNISNAILKTTPSDGEGSGSERSLAVAKAWLQRCEDEHPSCRKELGRLPTRVVDVGDGKILPKIYTSAGEHEPYVALSYCWGQEGNTLLLSTNKDEFQEGIAAKRLPRTIADAITITQKLGVKYLWVDALCILQDSTEDLKHELSHMGSIYANAWFTIAAKHAANANGGCFQTRDWSKSAIVPLNLRLSNITIPDYSLLSRRPTYMRTSPLNPVMAFWKPGLLAKSLQRYKIPMLETRCWTLQEEILSRRMLNCGEHELGWVCLTSKCSGYDPTEFNLQKSVRSADAIRTLLAGLNGSGQTTRSKQEYLFFQWQRTVMNYSRRMTSDHRDKIVALASVQEAIGRELGDTPAAGIWKRRFFAHGLLWKVSNEHIERAIEAFFCPSWSWASALGPVTYTL